MDKNRLATSVLRPYVHGVQDVYVEFGLTKLAKVKFVVDASIHDTTRHFAATRDDGLLQLYAPEIIELPPETVIAIIGHEFGHSGDFAYPAEWMMPPAGPGKATWLGHVEGKEAREWQRLWRDRAPDQVEWAADGIQWRVTGKKVGYCGPCMLQCFSGGVERPAGLR